MSALASNTGSFTQPHYLFSVNQATTNGQ